MTGKAKNKKAFKDLATGLLDEGRVIRLEASGYSMYPAIKPGYTIHIEPVAADGDINPGDIIAWKRETDMVVHRVIHRYKNEDKYLYLTRGDSSSSSDKPVPFNMIAGKVILIEAKSGTWAPEPKSHIPERKYRANRRRVWVIVRARKVMQIIGLRR